MPLKRTADSSFLAGCKYSPHPGLKARLGMTGCLFATVLGLQYHFGGCERLMLIVRSESVGS